jgi:hypothetical protein
MARHGFLAWIRPYMHRHPDNELPDAEVPIDPGYGIEGPVGIWPPDPAHPEQPIVLPPPEIWPPHPQPPPVVWPPRIDNTLPAPPAGIWPPPGAPDNSLPPTAGQLPIFPDSPGEPGTVWPPLPVRPDNSLPGSANCLVICWIPGVGYRWVVVDLSLKVTHPIAPGPEPK